MTNDTPVETRAAELIVWLTEGKEISADEVFESFSPDFLSAIPREQVIEFLKSQQAEVHGWSLDQTHLEGECEGIFVLRRGEKTCCIRAWVEEELPHRLTGFRIQPELRFWPWDDVAPRLSALDWCQSSLRGDSEILVNQFRDEHRVPGLVVQIVREEEVVHLQGMGIGNLDSFPALTAESVFRAGSIAKVITALGILRLVDKGKMNLDDPVEDHLRSFKVKAATSSDLPITLRSVLSHAAGLPRHQGDPSNASSLAEMVQGELQAVEAVGKETVYSNVGFAMLGQIIEDVTGVTYGKWVKQNVLDPLGMNKSSFAPNGPRGEVEGYERLGDLILSAGQTKIIEEGAGALCSTVDDLNRLSAAVWERRLFGAELWEEALRPQSTDSRVGFGFRRGKVDGRPLIWHNGAAPGWKAFWGCLIEERVGVAIVCNSYPLPIEKLGTALLRHALTG